MPRKITFTAIYATSEDPKHCLNELNTHGPTVRGWQSEKNSTYPQEIILQLERQAQIDKIQVLVHQYLIATKLELWISNDEQVLNTTKTNWDYIGYVILADNQSTGFKSRELKSVTVSGHIVRYLKLILGSNHSNTYNIYNQVSLIAINTIGFYIDPETDDTNEDDPLNDPTYSSPYDDLAFEMYVDSDVVSIVRQMELKKHRAVNNERFEYARKLKLAMECLRGVGEQLSKYELEKRHAIEIENYDRARLKKTQMTDYRTQMYKQFAVEQLLETNGIDPKNDECAETESIKPHVEFSPPTALKVPPASPLHQHNSRPKSPNLDHQRTGSFRKRNKSVGAAVKSSYEAYEERTLPALRHSQTNEFLRECQMDPDNATTTTTKPASKLTDREKKQAALPILVFGTELVELIYSKQYSDKEEGLKRLRDELRSQDVANLHTANKTARAAIFLLHRALRDKVFSVYSLANEVIRLFFVEFVPSRVSQAEVARSVDRLLPELLTKSGDQSARIHHMAVHTILTMADCRNVRELHQIPVHLSRPVSSSTHPRLALSRMEMVEQLIINLGISTDKQSGLTCRTLSEFGVSGLHHPAEAVRKVSERVLIQVYRVNPRLVRKHLPPDDDITRRNLLYRQLFHEFDVIDMERKKSLLERNRLIQQLSIERTQRNDEEEQAQEVQNGKKQSSDTSSNSMMSLVSSSSPASSGCQADLDTGGTYIKQCIFCLCPDVGNTDASLNVHYWRWCPMLIQCTECSQVVEITTLNDHLLHECDKHNNYTTCNICSDSIPINKYEQHIIQCQDEPENQLKCPLCHELFIETETAWRDHLMISVNNTGCLKNKRRNFCKINNTH